jgi:c-di-AMP phosphodiesterase-like protein
MDYMFDKLTESIKSHEKTIIMTHKKPDLDGMGASIGLSKIIESFKIECYIVYPDTSINKSLEKGISLLKENNVNINFKTVTEVKEIITENTLLIVLDTQKPLLVENNELLDLIKDIFVIDHHMNSSNHIDNTIFEYINSNKSSVVEIITEYYKHLNKTINANIATVMLSGLEIDTNSYNVKTSEATFKASALLLKNGANLIDKQNLLKETKEDFIRRQEYVRNSEIINENIAICIMDDKIHDNVDLAMISDELLRFDKVEASFTIGKLSDDTIGVSARSMGNISVGSIMTEIGGGGHATDAAAQIKDKTMEDVKNIIVQIIMEG